MNLTQLINGKTWNAGPTILKGKPATCFKVGWENFLDSGKTWAGIDCLLNRALTGFEVENAPFYFKAPKRSTGYAEFTVNNRFDLFKKSEITTSEFSQVMRCLGAKTIGGSLVSIADVPGELFDINKNGRFDAVIYRNAFPQWNADLIYYVEHGRAPRLKKLIRFNTAPSADIAVSFELEYNGKTELSPRELPDGITRVECRDLWKTSLGKGDKLYLHSDAADNQGLYVRAWDESQKRGIGIKQPLIWDSNPDPDKQKVWKIKTYLERIGINKYRLTKIIPKSFFTDAVFPVYTDTTSTFYPDPNPETNTVDGRVLKQGSWNGAHHSSSGTPRDNAAVDWPCYTGLSATPGSYLIARAFFLFDTSAIPDGDDISGATFSTYVELIDNNDNDGDDFLTVVQSSPASNTALSSGDFDQCGAIHNPIEGIDVGDRIDLTRGNGSFSYPFNATGISWINKTDITKLGVREGHDVVDSVYAGPVSTSNNTRTIMADRGSGGPQLSVAHTPTLSIPVLYHHLQNQGIT